MDRERLETELAERYDAPDVVVRSIGRQARDLADAGLIEDDLDHELTVEAVLDNVADAPEARSLVERWNWWLGSLELSHGGYDRFLVRSDLAEDAT